MALIDFNGDQVLEEIPACFLVRDSRGERPPGRFCDWTADLRARLLYQAMVFLGEGGDEFGRLYAQYAHQYRSMDYHYYYTKYYTKSPIFGLLKSLLKSMSPDWMASWSAFAPGVRDS